MRGLFIFVCLLSSVSLDCKDTSMAAACDHHRGGPTPIQSLPGCNPSDIDFCYESRVEKFSSTAHRYLWCIENRSDSTGAEFHWGNGTVEDLYFGAVVNPGPPKAFTGTNSRGFDSDLRILKYSELNSSQWRSINPQPQTISPRNIGEKLWVPSLIKKVQGVAQDPRLEDYKGPDGLIDIVRLSQNAELFRRFLASQEKGISFIFSSVATVPTSTRGVRTRIRRLAGCATPTSSAGHAGATANPKLTFHLDHSAGADQ
jgi:hypothetical protein